MEIKYEAVFGDQGLFEKMFKSVNPEVIYFTPTAPDGHKYTWSGIESVNISALDGTYVVAMRRIIPEPKRWTWADKEAGKLPEVGSNAQYINQGIAVEVIAIKNGWIVVVNVDGINREPFILPTSGFIQYCNPIESPEEKAARLREEWCIKALSSCSILSEMQKYELKRLGGYIEDIYDALLSGELPVPDKE